ncbi:hypothetical protein LJC10_05700 [Selenomonadales bacterium OttesenSCG-928-I06]|nr:hypothetical protein [Selenomonadales bacterium OttesenSCG-928-I06]
MKKLLIIILILLIGVVFSFFIYWRIAISECERLTYQYGKEFETVLKKDGPLYDKIEYIKILDYSDTDARVYCVWSFKAGGNAGGDIIRFSKEDGQWVYKGYGTVWSKKGNADDFVWPYVR